ncbi:MAG: ABC transporter ATP-binding protein [Acetivibrionales bacterium]|jgi:putative hydroxymethylpyrimidine transport system ATP-binding protein
MKNIIEISQLNKIYYEPDSNEKGLGVLSDINMRVAHNEFVSLLGPSGCGKSTLLKIIAGLDPDYEGNIYLEGKDSKHLRIPVCYMLQKDCLIPWRTMISNVLLPIEIRKGYVKKAKEEIRPLIAEFGLTGFENYKPGQLSGGMRQRAALLRTYLMQGEIMLLDEPFGALDEITRMQMQDWLISVWEKHRKTVLFVTHDIDEAIYLSDRVIVMSNIPGTIAGEIHIDFDRPRARDMLLSTQFNEYKRSLMDILSKS